MHTKHNIRSPFFHPVSQFFYPHRPGPFQTSLKCTPTATSKTKTPLFPAQVLFAACNSFAGIYCFASTHTPSPLRSGSSLSATQRPPLHRCAAARPIQNTHKKPTLPSPRGRHLSKAGNALAHEHFYINNIFNNSLQFRRHALRLNRNGRTHSLFLPFLTRLNDESPFSCHPCFQRHPHCRPMVVKAHQTQPVAASIYHFYCHGNPN